MATLKLNPAAAPVLGREVPVDDPIAMPPAGHRSLSVIALVQVSAGLAYIGWRVAAAYGAARGPGDLLAWWTGPLEVCATVAALAQVAAGTLLLGRRRATAAMVLWTQHAAAWSLAPVFLVQAAGTVILGHNAWVTAAPF
jgi:hypothetical protein